MSANFVTSIKNMLEGIQFRLLSRYEFWGRLLRERLASEKRNNVKRLGLFSLESRLMMSTQFINNNYTRLANERVDFKPSSAYSRARVKRIKRWKNELITRVHMEQWEGDPIRNYHCNIMKMTKRNSRIIYMNNQNIRNDPNVTFRRDEYITNIQSDKIYIIRTLKF
ncbi:hypothetical protein A3Q56_05000 [Intoshia linei]|uniref:Uncharacterized protein n=1 Tax=Intoshia linei TaxID=1819745 RepID=A0A177B0V8_9BILA|nr:hypothetical protein A3Q56_05000 [Intoshia linei]